MTSQELAAFARTVNRLAHCAPRSSRFGEDKVYISDLHAAWGTVGTRQRLGRVEFKRALAQASQAGLVRLARADLPLAANLAKVELSEMWRGPAEFHYVLDRAGA